MDATLPATLAEAMATEPAWLRAWIQVLVGANLAAVLFVVGRESGRWRFRPQAAAILASFLAAGVFMSWMYQHVGYVRLLGLAHLLFWGPVYAWILVGRRVIGTRSLYGKYIHVYLAIAGISLAVDAVDVIRHLVGDGELWGRHG